MPKKRTPGKSAITPIKHDLLNALLGKHAGVLTTPKVSKFLDREVWVDLTAGDGLSYQGRDWVEGCSPGIFCYHSGHISRITGVRVPVQVHLNELDPVNYSRLRQNLIENSADYSWATCSNKNATKLTLPDIVEGLDERTGVFLYNDANVISDFALSELTVNSCPEFTTSLSTLGCNIGGFKRSPMQVRESIWQDKVIHVAKLVQNWHDVGLLAIGDASEWVYLVTTPKKWTDEVTKSFMSVVKEWGRPVEKASHAWLKRDGEDAFSNLIEKCVYTKEERNAA